MESLAYWYGPRPDHTAWEDDLTMSHRRNHHAAALGREELVVDFSDSSLATMDPNHACGTVRDCIGYVSRLIEAGADEILFICQMGTVPQWAQWKPSAISASA